MLVYLLNDNPVVEAWGNTVEILETPSIMTVGILDILEWNNQIPINLTIICPLRGLENNFLAKVSRDVLVRGVATIFKRIYVADLIFNF